MSDATLNGKVRPNDLDCTVHFEYGTDTSYGTSTTGQDIPAGSTKVAFNADVTGLDAATVYHYRTVIVNANGTLNGADKTFTTLTPVDCDAVRAAKWATRVFIDHVGNMWNGNTGLWIGSGFTPAVKLGAYSWAQSPDPPILTRTSDSFTKDVTADGFCAVSPFTYGGIGYLADNAALGRTPDGAGCFFRTDNLVCSTWMIRTSGGRGFVLQDKDTLDVVQYFETDTAAGCNSVTTPSICADPFGGWWVQWYDTAALPATNSGGVLWVNIDVGGTIIGDTESSSGIQFSDPTHSRTPDDSLGGHLAIYRVEYL